jgi:hypothetical protein
MTAKTLSEEQFELIKKAATKMAAESHEVARLVLVEGLPQSEVAEKKGKSRQWVSELVKKFLGYAEKATLVPHGWKAGTVILPPSEWPKVREIERKARQSLSKIPSKKKRTR